MTPGVIAQRAKILLLKDAGKSCPTIVEELGINRHTADLWVKKYRNRSDDKLTKQMLKGIRVKSKEELASRIYKYFDEINSCLPLDLESE